MQLFPPWQNLLISKQVKTFWHGNQTLVPYALARWGAAKHPEAGPAYRSLKSLFHVSHFIYRQILSLCESFYLYKHLHLPSSCIDLLHPWKLSLKIKLYFNLASKKALKRAEFNVNVYFKALLHCCNTSKLPPCKEHTIFSSKNHLFSGLYTDWECWK